MVRHIVLLCLMLCLTAPGAAVAQPFAVSVNQFVEHPALDSVLSGFQERLEQLQVPVTYRIHNAQANIATATQIAYQIAGEKPDLVLAIATPSAQACAQAIKKSPQLSRTPLLFTAITDPVGAGLVTDLDRPGGMITGVSDRLPMDEHMANLRRFVPDLKTLGVIYNSGEANSKTNVALIREAGKRMGFSVIEATVSKSSEVYQAAKSLVGRADAVFVPTDNTVISEIEAAVKVCRQNRLPLFAADIDTVKRGAVAAMGFDYHQHGRQTADLALRILNGADPGVQPVEFQHDLLLYINMDAASKMGVSVSDELLSEAEQVYR
ncbi:MAG: ABC transporter substrate-binding protein [Desulfovibrionales bacterium]